MRTAMAVLVLLAAASDAAAQSRSEARIAAGIAAIGAGVYTLMFDPPDLVAHGFGTGAWAVTHQDWDCARRGSIPRGGRPERVGDFCAAVYTHHGNVFADRPAGRHNQWTRRVTDNTTYSGSVDVHTRTDVPVERSLAQYVGGAALLAAGGALIAFSRVTDAVDVDLDLADRRASVTRTVSW